jgi:Tfp pilus assembly protein PilV
LLGRRAFVLLEALLAVAIFALGVLALGRCISRGIAVERIRNEDARAARVLQNRWAEIDSGAAAIQNSNEKLTGEYAGMTLIGKQTPLHKKDELGRDLANLYTVTLTVEWQSDGDKQSRSITFYAMQTQP